MSVLALRASLGIRMPRPSLTSQRFAVNAFDRTFATRTFSSTASNDTGNNGSKEQGSNGSQGDEWTEVIDKSSGQTYYWNQRTGETTSLGEDKPAPGSERFEDAKEPAAASATAGVRFREVPEKDQTFKYTVYGVGIGVFSGWVTQFI